MQLVETGFKIQQQSESSIKLEIKYNIFEVRNNRNFIISLLNSIFKEFIFNFTF